MDYETTKPKNINDSIKDDKYLKIGNFVLEFKPCWLIVIYAFHRQFIYKHVVTSTGFGGSLTKL